jgi:DNA-binding Lrp family transcriptional regulator
MKALVLIKVATGEVSLVVKDLHRLHSVREAYAAFGPFDVIVILEADNLNKLGQIVANEIQPIPGIYTTLTCLEVESELPVSEKAVAEVQPIGLERMN